jgi:hypothetical protein
MAGDLIREFLLSIPLPVVRLLFVAVPTGVLIWVLLQPDSTMTSAGPAERPRWNLKWGAALALAIQIAIYLWL